MAKTKQPEAKLPEIPENHGATKFSAGLRWSIRAAAAEFTMDVNTLSKRLRQLLEEPGEDGKFSTAQICAAKFGSKELEMIRKYREDADGRKLKNDLLAGLVVSKAPVIAFFQTAFTATRNYILESELPQQDKDDICRELAEIFDANAFSRQIIS